MTDTSVIVDRTPPIVADSYAVHVRGLRMSFGGTEASQGSKEGVGRYVLAISTALVIVAFIIVYFTIFG